MLRQEPETLPEALRAEVKGLEEPVPGAGMAVASGGLRQRNEIVGEI